MPAPVGGAAGVCPFSKIFTPEVGVTESILFSIEFTVVVESALEEKFKTTLTTLSADKETVVKLGQPRRNMASTVVSEERVTVVSNELFLKSILEAVDSCGKDRLDILVLLMEKAVQLDNTGSVTELSTLLLLKFKLPLEVIAGSDIEVSPLLLVKLKLPLVNAEKERVDSRGIFTISSEPLQFDKLGIEIEDKLGKLPICKEDEIELNTGRERDVKFGNAKM
jgi:hypothetical protein